MLDPAAKVVSLDLNPVLLGSAGKGCVVVDAVVFQAVRHDSGGRERNEAIPQGYAELLPRIASSHSLNPRASCG